MGLPLALAIIGGLPERFTPFAELHRAAARAAGWGAQPPPFGINAHAFVARDARQAADAFYGPYALVMTRIGRERGWPPMSREQFDALRSPRGALLVGSVEQVIEKILFHHRLFGHQRFLAQLSQRFLAQLSVGTMPRRELLRAIELLGT